MYLPDNFVFTQSNLQDYVDCPRRFELRYLMGVRWPARNVDNEVDLRDWLAMGNQFHFMAHQFFSGLSAEVISRSIQDPMLMEWWQRFMAWHDEQDFSGQNHSETVLYAQVNGSRAAAKFDLINQQKDGRYRIIDWKTSLRKPGTARLLDRIQSSFYPLILVLAGKNLSPQAAQILPEQIEMMYWFTSNPDAPVVRGYDQSQFKADQSKYASLFQKIRSKRPGEFLLTEEIRHCQACSYRTMCDRMAEPGQTADYDDLAEENELVELLERMTSELDQIGEAWL